MEKEYKLWLELFKGILEENSYYENMQKIIKKDKNFSIASLVDDYLDNATFISVYYYLDSIEEWLGRHKGTIYDALQDLWETGNWKE